MFRTKMHIFAAALSLFMLVQTCAVCQAIEFSIDSAAAKIGTTYWNLSQKQSYTFYVVQEGTDTASHIPAERILYMNQATADASAMVSFIYQIDSGVPAQTILRGKDCETAKELTWVFSPNGTLTVYATDEVPRFTNSPWVSVQSDVSTLVITGSVSRIRSAAFKECKNLAVIVFEGNAPNFDPEAFTGITATVYYPGDNTTWTSTILQDYGGDLTWVAQYPTHEHTYRGIRTEPTCTEQGFTTFTCVCGDSYVSNYTEALGHNWDDGIVILDPTEETEGLMLCTCLRCKETKTILIPPLDHEHHYDAVVTPPTCTEQGYTTYTCACGDRYVTDYVVAPGHSMGEWELIKTPTDTEDGIEQRTCFRCGHTETRVISVTINDYTDYFTSEEWHLLKLLNQERHAAGLHPLTGFSLLQEVAQLFGSGSIGFGSAYDEVGLDYNPGEIGGNSSRSSRLRTPAEMVEEWKDGELDNTLMQDTFDSVGLKYLYNPDSKFPPHCWTRAFRGYDGTFTSYRVVMPQGDTFAAGTEFDEMDIYLVLEHSKDDFEHYLPLTEELVCIAEGSDTVTVSFDLLGLSGSFVLTLSHTHSYTTKTIAPTCTEQGYTTHTCSCGDSYIDSYTDPLGHSLGQWATVSPATCTDAGLQQRDCTRCSYSEVQVLEAHGHHFSDWIMLSEPTQTTDGTQFRYCDTCNAVETRIIPRLENPFTDIPADSFFYEPVMWAVENGITNGATPTTFDPVGTCLRAHVVTFLHRAVGNPKPASTNNPFTDVTSGDFFYDPVLWAVENGITNGVSTTAFGSYANCNRAAVVTFLWRTAGSPEPQSSNNPFEDVKSTDFFYKPVLWAVENGITNGIDATHFGPATDCNRAQVVTFLYRAYN